MDFLGRDFDEDPRVGFEGYLMKDYKWADLWYRAAPRSYGYGESGYWLGYIDAVERAMRTVNIMKEEGELDYSKLKADLEKQLRIARGRRDECEEELYLTALAYWQGVETATLRMLDKLKQVMTK